jgi:hypothetical protein
LASFPFHRITFLSNSLKQAAFHALIGCAQTPLANVVDGVTLEGSAKRDFAARRSTLPGRDSWNAVAGAAEAFGPLLSGPDRSAIELD